MWLKKTWSAVKHGRWKTKTRIYWRSSEITEERTGFSVVLKNGAGQWNRKYWLLWEAQHCKSWKLGTLSYICKSTHMKLTSRVFSISFWLWNKDVHDHCLLCILTIQWDMKTWRHNLKEMRFFNYFFVDGDWLHRKFKRSNKQCVRTNKTFQQSFWIQA